MQIDVGASIGELLYEHNTVVIPRLGSFVSNYKPATIDQVEGKIQPPSKQLTFNKNLLIDDGLLVQHLRKKYKVSYPTAMLAVEQFASEARGAIERREIFTIHGVGRLYKDYEQNLQFLPDNTNFNTDAYGLPTIKFYPVLRNARETASRKTAPSPATLPKSTPAKTPRSSWLQRNLVPIASVLVITVALTVYFHFFKPSALSGVPAERYNVPPSRVANDAPNPALAPGGDELPLEDADTDTEGATLRPEQQYALIGLGIFSKPENVERLVRQIYEAGYEPFTEKVGQLTRVGIRKAYAEPQEIEKTLTDIEKKLGIKAQVLKR